MSEVQKALGFYRSMLTARLLDQIELDSVNRGEAWFHTSGAGHEAGVALNSHLKDQDWLHAHYRDKALLLARGITSQEFFDSLYCNANSSSHGRQMNPLTSSREKNVMSMVIPVGNGALQSVGVAAAIKNNSYQPIVVCSVGDGTSQQGEFLEAIAEAVRSELPVLFFVQDNALAISTRTQGKTFFSYPQAEAESFYGLPIHRINGRDVMTADRLLEPLVNTMRSSRQPAIVLFSVERIHSHSNADDQSQYRTESELQQCHESGDPLLQLETFLLDNGLSDEQLIEIKQEVKARLIEEEATAKNGVQPETTPLAIAPLPVELEKQYTQAAQIQSSFVPTTMREAINKVLHHQLSNNESVVLYGEDIEDPKGDVFGVTKGLSTNFDGRVINSPLSEATIVGTSIGRAFAGQKPVCFIQFADFLPHAFNQIISELATIFWRSNGDWNASVIVMVACGAYRPGLGPFHAQSFESILAHTPGLDVFLPSNAADAAGLLNSAFASDRPSIFFYPKSLLNRPDDLAPQQIDQHFNQIGSANVIQNGSDLTFVAWGNTVDLCVHAAEELQKVDKHCDIIDIACLSPWDKKAVLQSAQKTGKVIVVQEDNHSCGFGAELVATISEQPGANIVVRRLTRPDTYLPFNFINQKDLLPSFESVLACAADLLQLSLSWKTENQAGKDQALVTAIGSGPSDETVEVIEIPIKVGDKVNRGDVLLVVEASKSIVDMTSSWSGVVAEILVEEQDVVKVGNPVVVLDLSDSELASPNNTRPVKQVPLLVCQAPKTKAVLSNTSSTENGVGIYQIATAMGSEKICNETILSYLSDDQQHSSEQIERLTGIEMRYWVGKDQTALSLATAAARSLLEKSNIQLSDIDLIVCATTTPDIVNPSIACQVLKELSQDQKDNIQAYDILAACSGYLYALQSAYDYIVAKPNAKVMVITTEVLSPLLNTGDFDTYILFGDAATATLVCGQDLLPEALAKLNRPVLSAKPDKKDSLSVPLKGRGFIEMDGRIVFSEAVRAMNVALRAACEQQELAIDQLKMVVPHQASQRIMNAVADRINIDVFTNVKQVGNTSSSSIPLALESAIQQSKRGDQIGLCAFGAGFTFGAGILEVQ